MNLDLENEYDDLVELIYQIPINNQAWQQFCRKLIYLLDISYIHIQALDFRYNVLSYSNGIGKRAPEEYAQAEVNYLHYPKDADPRWVDFLNPARQGWYQCHHYVTDECVAQSAFYQQILLPHGLRYVATHDLIWDDAICVYWSLSTSVERQPLNQEELAYLNRFNKHLRRVANIQRHKFEYSPSSLVGYGLIDKISQPILLLNLAGHMIHANQVALKFLDENSIISCNEQKSLILPDPQHQQLQHNLYELEMLHRKNNILSSSALKNSYIHLVDQNGESMYLFLSLLVSEQEQLVFGSRPLVMLNIYHPKYAAENASYLYRVFDRLNTGVVLLDQDQHVFYKNLIGQKILDNSKLLNMGMGHHQLKVEKTFHDKFAQLLAKAYALNGVKSTVSSEQDILVLYDEDELLILNIVPISHIADVNHPNYLNDIVAIFVRQPSKHYLLRDLLKQKYKLTNRELEICHLFIHKMNLEEISEVCDVTRSSLKTYMKNIFAKVEVNSQSELMHLLLTNTTEHTSYG